MGGEGFWGKDEAVDSVAETLEEGWVVGGGLDGEDMWSVRERTSEIGKVWGRGRLTGHDWSGGRRQQSRKAEMYWKGPVIFELVLKCWKWVILGI